MEDLNSKPPYVDLEASFLVPASRVTGESVDVAGIVADWLRVPHEHYMDLNSAGLVGKRGHIYMGSVTYVQWRGDRSEIMATPMIVDVESPGFVARAVALVMRREPNAKVSVTGGSKVVIQ